MCGVKVDPPRPIPMQMQRQAALTGDLLRMLANLESDLRSVLMHEPTDSATEEKAP
jgi:hypothetical protein